MKKFKKIFFSNKMSTSEIVTPGLDNTSTKPVRRRVFLLTVNEKSLEHYDDIKEYLEKLKGFIYMLVVEHIGQENKHYHITVQYENPKSLSIKKLYGSHINPMKFGSIQKMVSYCKCEDKKHKNEGITYKLIYENGEPKLNGGFKSVRDIIEADKDDLIDINPHLYRICKEIRNDYKEEEDFDKVLDEIDNDKLRSINVYYVYGKPGEGKTYGAYKEALKIENHNKQNIGRCSIKNGFCKFIRPNASTLIIGEFRPSQIEASEFLEMTDKYGHTCYIKGGHQWIRPNNIFICSVKHPTEIYKDENNKQFIRRITKFYQAEDKKLVEKQLKQIENQHYKELEESDDEDPDIEKVI